MPRGVPPAAPRSEGHNGAARPLKMDVELLQSAPSNTLRLGGLLANGISPGGCLPAHATRSQVASVPMDALPTSSAQRSEAAATSEERGPLCGATGASHVATALGSLSTPCAQTSTQILLRAEVAPILEAREAASRESGSTGASWSQAAAGALSGDAPAPA